MQLESLTQIKGLSPGTKGPPWVNSKGEHLGHCHMWCAVELVRNLRMSQEVLGSNLTYTGGRSIGFQLGLKPALSTSVGCSPLWSMH